MVGSWRCGGRDVLIEVMLIEVDGICMAYLMREDVSHVGKREATLEVNP